MYSSYNNIDLVPLPPIFRASEHHKVHSGSTAAINHVLRIPSGCPDPVLERYVCLEIVPNELLSNGPRPSYVTSQSDNRLHHGTQDIRLFQATESHWR